MKFILKNFLFTIFIFLLASCSTQSDHKNATFRKDDVFRIIQLGDSHTAGDYFTNALRDYLQRQRGDAGIGIIPPQSVAGQRVARISYENNPWTLLTSKKESADFPLGGVIAITDNSPITIREREPSYIEKNMTFTLKPTNNMGYFTVSSQEKRQKNNSFIPNKWQYTTLQSKLPVTIQLPAGWQLSNINIENINKKGVTLSHLGMNGAQLTQINKWRNNWLEDLKQAKANMVILAYGTNEAANAELDIISTKSHLVKTIRNIKKSLSNVKIVIVGAPEALSSQAGRCGVRLPMLDSVQQMQQSVAKQEGVYFWSWEKAMGGRCSMKSWIAQGLARKDGVHFSAEGYQRLGRQFGEYVNGLID